jgi:hypothetical protein
MGQADILVHQLARLQALGQEATKQQKSENDEIYLRLATDPIQTYVN